MPLFSNAKFPERPAGADEVVLGVRDIQMITLDLLLLFDAFCKEHGLRYYLCGGTLLGAVRHKGFIPWDDDIDIVMSRPEYDRLLTLCAENPGVFGADTRFACPENGGFMRPFARIYFTKTDVQRKYYDRSSGMHVWLDILPIDGLPNDPKKLEKLYQYRWHLNRLNCAVMWKQGCAARKLYVLKKWTYYPFACLMGIRFWCNQLDKLGRSRPYEKYDTVGCLTGGRYGAGELMPKAEFEIPAKVMFEGHEFETMSCWEQYLTGIYGDYMKLPPENKRIPHLDYVTMQRADYDELCARHPELKAK